MQQGETISAIATAPGAGGIGVIRISGAQALTVADRVFRAANGRKLAELPARQVVYGHAVDAAGEVIDEVMAIVMRAPHSYTCEDVVELQAHGSNVALRQILRLTWQAGARQAERGEFTKRAFLNGRLDISQARAVMDIIQAPTEYSLRMAEGHLAGYFSGKIQQLQNGIMDMTAQLEAAIDFPEDGVEEATGEEIRTQTGKLRQAIAQLLHTAHTGRILKDGLMTAIVGKPNVGKSSLLNALLREERAIVTDIPGTTRDAIEEYAEVGGVPLRIIDTAGIRATDDVVEQMGVEKAKEYVSRATLVLALFDGSRPLAAEDEEILALLSGKTALLLLTKADLPAVTTAEQLQARVPEEKVLTLSTRTGAGLDELGDWVHDFAWADEIVGEEDGFVSDEQQAETLRQADAQLAAALATLDSGMGLDCVSIDLRAAWEKLGELTGRTVREDLLDEIFSRFCIGK
ncbi:MAG: tRNA uridine-5-carboxymethylaminomethyl(34) synthesis GTPase MnmE [Selenomonadaceae bacterium]|nr:tRNA uridine-5-carboxymethylaminomethyl(34) synthesis GTPase MnmE [Selenomonadaceae bacterium]MDD7056445.1 tRNA uridine-5-carboxymethylaminomethyl(34) synthesis GTPase MnmE [Selenomonadaceae bacterium]